MADEVHKLYSDTAHLAGTHHASGRVHKQLNLYTYIIILYAHVLYMYVSLTDVKCIV